MDSVAASNAKVNLQKCLFKRLAKFQVTIGLIGLQDSYRTGWFFLT